MENGTQNQIFTTNFKAGQRMFFLNMCEAKNSSKYLKITESKMGDDGEYQHHGIMIFEQDFEKLTKALDEVMSKVDLKEIAKETRKANKDCPNAGLPWAEEDESKMEKLFNKGNTIESMMKLFGRTAKSITARLQKLELIEE